MVDVSLLGPMTVESGGRRVEGRAAQRKRLLLLALLADPPLHRVPREKLIGLLWPDHRQDSALHLLSASLYVLRSVLEEGALQGDLAHVWLDPARVRVDAATARAAADGPEPEAALSLFRGEYLEGMTVEEGSELEHWLDRRRGSYRDLHLRLLERAAEMREATGRAADAVPLWKRATELDPYSGHLALRLMQALVGVGDPGDAILHARSHMRFLRDELGAAPEPAVVALSEKLRVGSAPLFPGKAVGLDDPPSAPEPAHDWSAGSAPPPAPPPGRPPSPARRRSGTPRTRPQGSPRRSPVLTLWWVAAALAGLVFMAIRSWPTTRIVADPVPDPPGVAVLPFEVQPGPDIHHLGEGMAEQIIMALAALDGVRVPGRASSFGVARQTRDPAAVGRRLQVQGVVGGSVGWEAGELVVWVELVGAGDGFQIWSDRFQVPPDGGLLTLAYTVATRITEAMVPDRLPGGDPAPQAVDPEALDLYLRARHAWGSQTSAGVQAALDLFRRAVEADPGYARAWAGLAAASITLGSLEHAVLPPERAFTEARQAAERALGLDPALAAGHTALGAVHFLHDGDPVEAEASFRRALALEPGHAPTHQWLALLHASRGRWVDAHAHLDRAMEQEPLSPSTLTTRARVFYYQRRWDDALHTANRALEQSPDFSEARILGALARIHQGRPGEAARILEESTRGAFGVIPARPLPLALMAWAAAAGGDEAKGRAILRGLENPADGTYVPPAALAVARLGLGDREGALAALEAARDTGPGSLIYLEVEPLMDRLRPELRFQRLLEPGPPAPSSSPHRG